MTMVSIGDLARGLVLQRQTVATKADVNRLSEELASGRVTDVAARLRGDLAALASLEGSLGRIDGWKSAAREVGQSLEAMQSVLAAVDTRATEVSATLLAASSGANPLAIDFVGPDARMGFATVVGLLNTRFADRTLFAGAETGRAALAPAETMLGARATEVAGATTAAQAAAAVDAWFAAPTGFGTLGYLGGTTVAGPVPIGVDEIASLPLTAADPALRDTIAGLALAALLDEGLFTGNPAARRDVARLAGERLATNAAARSATAARVGLEEQRVARAEARNGAEAVALTRVTTALREADPYETAAALELAQTRIETLYAITARLSRLSLVDFLR